MANNSDTQFSYRLPDWFRERNIRVPSPDGFLPESEKPDGSGQDETKKFTPSDAQQDDQASGYVTDAATGFSASKESLAELLDMARGLMVFDKITDALVPESTFLLSSTTTGAAWRDYLEWVVEDLARMMGAVTISVSLQDLENLGTDLFDQEIEWRKVHGKSSRPSWFEHTPKRKWRYPMAALYFSSRGQKGRLDMVMTTIFHAAQDKYWEQLKDRDEEPDTMKSLEKDKPSCDAPFLLHIRDAEDFGYMPRYDEEDPTGLCIRWLNSWVKSWRKEGQEIALTYSTSGQQKWYEKVFLEYFGGTPSETMVIEPREPITKTQSAEFEKARIRQNNIWNLKRCLCERCPKLIQPGLLYPFAEWTGQSERDYMSIGQLEWLRDDIKRATIQISGRSTNGKPVDLDDIWVVLRRLFVLESLTEDEELESEQPETELEKPKDETNKTEEQIWNEKLRAMVSCNKYETKLLDSVVNPAELDLTWDDVILDDETKDTMMQLVAMSRFRPKTNSSFMLKNIRINGALLYGPPGTGKTHLCRAIAAASGSNMLSVDSAALQSKWVGETEKYVKAAFTLAEQLHPCVLFMDEVDSMFYRRSSDDKEYQRRSLTQFLTGMDGMSKSGKAPFVLVATNRPWDLDEAFLRRLPQKIFFYLPGEECRRRILGTFVTADDLDSDVDLADIAKATEGYSGSDLRSVCAQAGLSWTMEQVRKRGTNSDVVLETTELKLNKANFKRAIQMIRPSNSATMPREMVQFVKRFNPDVLEQAPTKDQ